MELRVFSLHEHPEYLEACAMLMNEEWPRSHTARLHSLEKSCATLPYNIVLVDTASSPPDVLAHSRITVVIGVSSACFVESVVVKKSRRGEGLGKIIMHHTEELAKGLGFEVMYLTTHDKQGFYSHIGYQFCQPVVTAGAACLLLQRNSRLLQNLEKQGRKCVTSENIGKNNTSQPSQEQECTKSPCEPDKDTDRNIDTLTSHVISNCDIVSENCKAADSLGDNPQVTGAVTLSPENMPPPPPPPVPAFAPKVNSAKEKPSITRMSPSDISWMKKSLK